MSCPLFLMHTITKFCRDASYTNSKKTIQHMDIIFLQRGSKIFSKSHCRFLTLETLLENLRNFKAYLIITEPINKSPDMKNTHKGCCQTYF